MKEGRERKQRERWVYSGVGLRTDGRRTLGCAGGGASGGMGGALAGNHPLTLALICYVSLPLWAPVFTELSRAAQVPF